MGVLKTLLSWSRKLKHYWWSVDLAGVLEVTRITEKKNIMMATGNRCEVKLQYGYITIKNAI